MIKSSYTKNDIQTFLSNKLNSNIKLSPVIEGMDSQVYSYAFDGKDYIIRINPNLEGFRKDEYAYKHFNSDIIPIPKIVEYGKYNDTHYYCISEKVKGITYEDSPENVIIKLLPDITKIKQAINNIDISNTSGYGVFDSQTKNAPYNTNKEYTSSVLKNDFEKIKTFDFIDSELLDSALKTFQELLEFIPETRALLHGDFGNNNIIVAEDESKFSAVIDWDCAAYGDPLETVAGAYFWSNWLLCADKVWHYWKEIYQNTPHFNEIIACYSLKDGLAELYENAIDKDFETIDYVQNRIREILNKYYNLGDINKKYY